MPPGAGGGTIVGKVITDSPVIRPTGRNGAPAAEIAQLLRAGDTAGAMGRFEASGGDLFPFLHGYPALAKIVEAAPERLWRDNEAYLGALCFHLCKQGRAGRARACLMDPSLRFRPTIRTECSDLLISIHLGDPITDEDIARWQTLERRLPLDAPLREGLYHNAMLANLVRLNRLTEAHTAGRRALESYREAGHSYLEHFIHLHLADLSVVEGHLRMAARHVDAAERLLRHAGIRYRNEYDLIETLRLTLDYETGRLEAVPSRAQSLRRGLITGDSWAELFIELCRIGTMATFFAFGRDKAMHYLEACQVDFSRRHGWHAAALDLVQAEIERLDGREDACRQALAAACQQPIHSALGHVLLRNLTGPEAGEASAAPPGPRAAIVDALQAARAAFDARDGTAQRRHVERALRLAVDEGHMAPFLEHRDAVTKVAGRFASGRFARGHTQLARMARRTFEQVRKSYVVPRPMRALGIGHRQFRVVTALRSGATNKQIARSLGISEATVKYHISALLREFEVAKRGELIEKVRRISESAPD